jgi:hypothetical protein
MCKEKVVNIKIQGNLKGLNSENLSLILEDLFIPVQYKTRQLHRRKSQ